MLLTALSVAGVLVAVAAAYLALAPQRSARGEAGIERFRRTRRHLKGNIGALAVQAIGEQESLRAGQELPVLAPEDWIPSRPLPVQSISLKLHASALDEGLAKSRVHARRLLPTGRHGVDSYSAAIGLYDQPKIWFDGRVYRLLDIQPDRREEGPRGGGLELTFGVARYFDAQDTSEVLAYELADRSMRRKRGLTHGAYRKWLASPFRLDLRCAVPGINVLTIRCASDGSFFFMHHRDASSVGVSMNLNNVTPAGEFQPHNDDLAIWKSDLDIWASVMREYAEEFLGHRDSAGELGVSINYQRDEPYRQFTAARERGDAALSVLGIGMDPVSWKPEISAVCLWKARTFDRIFADMINVNSEGIMITGERKARGYSGIPFNEANVTGYANDPATLPAGRMSLKLAWRWRHDLGIPGC